MTIPQQWAITLTDSGPWGECDYQSRTIAIRREALQDPARFRAVLAHELVHAQRGPCPNHPAAVAAEELIVTAEAGRMLVTPDQIGTILALSAPALAEQLGVDPLTMRVRMATLTAEEERTVRGVLLAPHWPAIAA